MGQSNLLQQLAEFQSNFTLEGPKSHSFFGSHYLLSERSNPQKLLIRKEFIFRSGQYFQQVCREYYKIQRTPFNLIYPSQMINSVSLEHCSTIKQIYLYFEIVGKPLEYIIENQGPLSQVKAWFLLNQLSKALEILQENGRAHWAISPQTVYRNINQNFLIYDSLFVLGHDPTNFLKTLKDSQEMLTQQTQGAINRGIALGPWQGHQQDMYGLGMTLFFAVTGVHARNLPSLPHKQEWINKHLAQRQTIIGQGIVRMVKQLTERQFSRRLNNNQLRKLLKQRQAEIIRKETIEYQSIHRHRMEESYKINSRIPNSVTHQQTNRNAFSSPEACHKHHPNTHENQLRFSKRERPNQSKVFVSPQGRLLNRQSMWRTKRSTAPYSHDVAVLKDTGLARVFSYDQFLLKR